MSHSDNQAPRVVLASRKNAGTRVTLLWAPETNSVAVLVRDASTKERFELVIEPDASPTDVFEHPYAYAAWLGIDYRPLTCCRRPEASEATLDMDTTTLAAEATRYLEAVDLFRSLSVDIEWRSEADEVGAYTPLLVVQRPRWCERCAGPLVRINGQHVCFRT